MIIIKMKVNIKSVMLGTAALAGLMVTSQAVANADTMTIKSGDTVWEYAQKYNVSISDIVKANKLSDANLIIAGQKIDIPGVKTGAATSTSTAAKKTTTASASSAKSTSAAATSQATSASTTSAAATSSSVTSASSTSQATSSSAVTSTAAQSSTSTASASSSVASSASTTSASSVSSAAASSATSTSSQAVSSSSQAVSSSSTTQSAATSTSSQSATSTASQSTNSSSSQTTATATAYTASTTSAASTSSSTTSSSTTTSTSTSATASALIAAAKTYLGTPYEQMDCSAFTQAAFAKVGISIGRTTYAQATVGSHVSFSSAQAGDLIFWGSDSAPYHVGIYLGNGQYIASPTNGETVSIKSTAYYTPSFAIHMF
ncbi:extracellular protein, gamma-d-glutamate-meso-diaminopimelate muropeptidase [Lactiplantibacillus fabifermentans DSM 21115]|uniref:Extracellular protein, gamma-d-glutamate-meso-diaminopimelate muropeptidase n=1 Tax=Lactiplantibacillus fabifermentans DSM 21115 TaxID=1413187 RepID=A0A0R2NWU3_9LACO|nr:extracellular protein, gamma-d-glutamate-meso-diaminopimelate muropeptidase [Lactiplantibacillus fabifermentans DSM 21115]